MGAASLPSLVSRGSGVPIARCPDEHLTIKIGTTGLPQTLQVDEIDEAGQARQLYTENRYAPQPECLQDQHISIPLRVNMEVPGHLASLVVRL